MNRPLLKFAANISTMFQEKAILDRLEEARQMGFAAFEAQNLYDCDIGILKSLQNAARLEMILINSPPDISEDQVSYFGYACLPGEETQFVQSLQQAIKFAKELDCKKIHILAGLKGETDILLLKKTYIQNLRLAADMLKKENLLGVIEPICPKVKPSYFLDDFDLAVECIKEVGSKNLKLLLDIYHLEMLHGDALNLIEKYYPYAGHIQVSQAPNREEPSASGLIDYKKVFEVLESKGYSDYIGLEYTPKRSTAESLAFLKSSGFFCVDFNNFEKND